MDNDVAPLWDLITQIAEKVGVLPIPEHFPKLWVLELPDDWLIDFNGHGEKVEHVPAYSFLVSFRGTPAGVIDPFGGALGEGLYDDLIAAMKKKVAELDSARKYEDE